MVAAATAERVTPIDSARALLDNAQTRIAAAEHAQRDAVAALVQLWPTAAWKAAGATSPARWIAAYTNLTHTEAARLERIARPCAQHPALAAAVADGRMSLGRADLLGRYATTERSPFLAEVLHALVQLAATTTDDASFTTALRYWAEYVDEHLKPRRTQPHSLHMSQGLFGGGELHAQLHPVAFATIRTAIDAWTQDADPAGAPRHRTLSERRADALDDLAHHSLTHNHNDPDDADPTSDEVRADDTFDGSYVADDLDRELASLSGPDPSDEDRPEAHQRPTSHSASVLREHIRHVDQQRRRRNKRRIKPRSGVTVNIHLDLKTLTGTRHIDDFDDLVQRGETWDVARNATDQLLCDSSLVATLFNGRRLIDANTAAEQFTKSQRRAIAARDQHCVFPSCHREPRHCDIHHLQHLEHGGQTTTANGACLCRHHHRLLHNGWHLTQDHTGHWIATDPHGTTWPGRPPDKPTHQN